MKHTVVCSSKQHGACNCSKSWHGCFEDVQWLAMQSKSVNNLHSPKLPRDFDLSYKFHQVSCGKQYLFSTLAQPDLNLTSPFLEKREWMWLCSRSLPLNVAVLCGQGSMPSCCAPFPPSGTASSRDRNGTLSLSLFWGFEKLWKPDFDAKSEVDVCYLFSSPF